MTCSGTSGTSHIVLVVEPASYPRDSSARNDLADEHDTSPPSFRATRPDIEPQIDLFEVPMTRDGDTLDFRVQEEEPDHTDVRYPLPVVDLCPTGRVQPQHPW